MCAHQVGIIMPPAIAHISSPQPCKPENLPEVAGDIVGTIEEQLCKRPFQGCSCCWLQVPHIAQILIKAKLTCNRSLIFQNTIELKAQK